MDDKNTHLDVKLTARQQEAWRAFFDPSVRELMYGGAKGGGKSYFLCVLMYTLSLMIIDQHDLQATDKPLHWAWMGRKIGSDFVGTTLDTWQRVIPSDCYRICGASDIHPRHILIWDRIAIDFGGLDSQQAINKFNSAEYAVIAVDQAEETTKDDVAVLMGSRRLKINNKPWLVHDGNDMPFKGIWTANPAQCWLKEDFIDHPKDNYQFVRALPADNPYLPEDYESITLMQAFGHRPELLRAYRDGDWDIMAGAQQIINPVWISSCKVAVHKQHNLPHISCDTARYGDDETVICTFDSTSLVGVESYAKTDVNHVSNLIIAACRKANTCHVTIESTGADLGAGAIDLIGVNAPDIDITIYCPQGKPHRQPLGADGKPMQVFGNLRAEAWSYAAERLSLRETTLPDDIDIALTNQLCWPMYTFKSGKTFVESKDDIKARMHRSPDWADAYVMGLWGSQFVKSYGDANSGRGSWQQLKAQYS